jgi:hypothetical protein
MTLLSICIPVFGRSPGSQAAVIDAVRQMLGNARDDFQIVIGDFSGDTEPLSRFATEQFDPRLTVISPGSEGGAAACATNKAACCNWMIPHASGAWICMIDETDYADPDICTVLEATLKRVPQADALSWSRAGYVWPAARGGREIARIGTGSSLNLPQQKDLMQKLFYWADAGARPDCFFGAWHGAVKRELLERIRAAFSDVYFEQEAPETDSLCKTVLMAQCMVFWERPLSVQAFAGSTAKPPAEDGDRLEGFPFGAEMGSAAAVAVSMERFKQRYGIELDGWEAGFIQACASDCETATSGEEFHARKAAYAQAITQWRGKKGLAGFKPEFRRNPKLPRFQGLKRPAPPFRHGHGPDRLRCGILPADQRHAVSGAPARRQACLGIPGRSGTDPGGSRKASHPEPSARFCRAPGRSVYAIYFIFAILYISAYIGHQQGSGD